ncbi:MAG: hypothetical protein HYZ50_24525 [Deltaproteobacteria bacterium]|nr:hypothetical protein [Deltaproteobacteria bacterium]
MTKRIAIDFSDDNAFSSVNPEAVGKRKHLVRAFAGARFGRDATGKRDGNAVPENNRGDIARAAMRRWERPSSRLRNSARVASVNIAKGQKTGGEIGHGEGGI